MAKHLCQYDYTDDITLTCKECKGVIMIFVTPRQQVLHGLYLLGMLKKEGKAWQEFHENNMETRTLQ